MFLHALATAVPARCFTQNDCYELAHEPSIRGKLTRRSQLLVRAVLRGDSGVDRRYFALSDMPGVFSYTADQLNEGFRREGPKLATDALVKALAQVGAAPAELDALLICTCTGYLCPGLTSYVSEQLGLRPSTLLHDIAGLGCGAAIPTLRVADALLRANPDALIATVAVEVCSAAFYLDDDPGVLISACLFGDGAAAALWRSTPSSTGLRCHGFSSHHAPLHRDKIRFEHREGKLRNLLDAAVPDLAAEAVSKLLNDEQTRPGGRAIRRIISHPGGRDVLTALERALPDYSFETSREVLRAYGNMSSPSVLFVLDEALRKDRPGEQGDWWLVSFGAGFSAHACRFGS